MQITRHFYYKLAAVELDVYMYAMYYPTFLHQTNCYRNNNK